MLLTFPIQVGLQHRPVFFFFREGDGGLPELSGCFRRQLGKGGGARCRDGRCIGREARVKVWCVGSERKGVS